MSFDLNPQKGSGPIYFKGYCLLQELNTQPGVVGLINDCISLGKVTLEGAVLPLSKSNRIKKLSEIVQGAIYHQQMFSVIE